MASPSYILCRFCGVHMEDWGSTLCTQCICYTNCVQCGCCTGSNTNQLCGKTYCVNYENKFSSFELDITFAMNTKTISNYFNKAKKVVADLEDKSDAVLQVCTHVAELVSDLEESHYSKLPDDVKSALNSFKQLLAKKDEASSSEIGK